jgi:hypothetical protein
MTAVSQSVPAFLLQTPGGDPAARRKSFDAARFLCRVWKRDRSLIDRSRFSKVKQPGVSTYERRAIKKDQSCFAAELVSTTSAICSEEAPPSYGQCAPTAIVIWERFGGEILKTDGWPPNGRHFYNRIDGTGLDFTADQFEDPQYSHKVEYKDLVSNSEEAEAETLLGNRSNENRL